MEQQTKLTTAFVDEESELINKRTNELEKEFKERRNEIDEMTKRMDKLEKWFNKRTTIMMNH
jgi:prefoldin subunit 5